MTEIKMGEYQSRNDLDEDSVSNFSCSPEDVKKYYIPSLQKQIQQLQADKEELKRVITKAISGLEYAAFNLTKLKKVEKLPPGIMESTGPEDTLLIELRDLKDSTQEG